MFYSILPDDRHRQAIVGKDWSVAKDDSNMALAWRWHGACMALAWRWHGPLPRACHAIRGHAKSQDMNFAHAEQFRRNPSSERRLKWRYLLAPSRIPEMAVVSTARLEGAL